ncbi:centrobin [Platysternon megacephalum]|uniref:Centrobin n=1 Tax=Platysternon megacephalum TaxID=55544 RepID=A0A4D9DGX8_9SAUR|nr:centrobin [Platysternon megacephalum]
MPGQVLNEPSSQRTHGMMMDTQVVVWNWARWILDLPLPPEIAGDRRSGAQEQMVLGQPGEEPKLWRIVSLTCTAV